MSQSTGTRRGRFRFLYQFSLRTLLLLTAAVAIFCNWYFQPKYHEEELAGKDLRVRQQMKAVELPYPTPVPHIVNHGHYTLLDGDDFVLGRGHFVEGEESGRWVTYYPTGHKAAEGKMHSGVKVGLWRTWYEDGTLASEVTYADKPVERKQLYREYWEWMQVRNIGGGFSGIFPDKVIDPHIDCYSSREGPIKAWYANGQLRYEGQNRADQQEGVWKYYDEQGRLTDSGPYRAGKRHGTWTLTRNASEGKARRTESVDYLDGRTRDELDRLLTRLEKQLENSQRYRRTRALIDLAEIGEGAVPVFQRRLATDDPIEQFDLLAVLPRMKQAAEPLLPRVRELTGSSNLSLAHQARLTLYQLDEGARDSLYERLVADATSAPSLSQSLQELVILYRSDEKHRTDIFARLMSLPLQRSDADSEQISRAVHQLGGDVGPHLVLALKSPSDRVRLQGAQTLLSLLIDGYWLDTYASFDEPTWNALVAAVTNDSSPEVRALAEQISQGPRFYGGGFVGGSFF